MYYLLQLTPLSFGWGDVPALLVLLTTIIVFMVKYHKLKREVKDLEEQLTYIYAEDVGEADLLDVVSVP